ncbi:unnamed protein product [Paramecium primaurelia]|uniref:Protein kinase domain-containing protein n=1 Tax=Paramecium primaurelia TaxID=5886 RepID=A0A8S1L7A7_PARPR|nr:unnamed protein product [Paramecium primaurelia]
MIFDCQVIRKHLLIDKYYQLQFYEDRILIGQENRHPTKYEIALNLTNRISWKLNEKQQIIEFGIKYNNNIKWFTGKNENLQRIKQLLTNKIFNHSISTFYQSSELIGQGASSKVITILDQNKFKYAAKCISKDYITKKKTPDRLNRLISEITILRSLLNHQNVIQLLDIFEGESTYYLIFEYLQGDTLHKFLKQQSKPLSEEMIRIILAQLLQGIHYIHQNNYIHRDIKLENIVLSTKQSIQNLKIIDFGLAIPSTVFTPFAICGTPGYIAPEILQYKESSQGQFRFTSKVDMFGIGVMLYRMMTRKSLFDSENTKELLSLNRKCQLPKLSISGYSNELNNLLFGLLESNPIKRLSSEESLIIMNITQMTQELQLSQFTTFQYDQDDFEVEHSIDYANAPYQFPNKFMKYELENSFHYNEDHKHSSLHKSFKLSFSLRISQEIPKQDFVIEDFQNIPS